MKHKMKLLEDPFMRILNGSKEVEFRLYDEKRRKIRVGDTIEFSKLPDLQEKMTVEVVDLYKAQTFKELLSNLGYQGKELEYKLKQKMYSLGFNINNE